MKVDELTNALSAEFGYRSMATDANAAEVNQIANAAMQAIIARKDNLTVNKANGVGVPGVGGADDIPELDEAEVVKAMDDVLLKLIMYLQLETDEKLTKVQQDRIDSEKNMIEQRHNQMMDKIAKNLKAMDKAAKAAAMAKIFGWIGAAIAVAIAIVVTVASFGAAAPAAAVGAGAAVGAAAGAGAGAGAAGAAAAAGVAAAAGAAAGGAAATGTAVATIATWKVAMAIASAVVAVTSQILNETGGMEKINGALADSIQSTFGVDRQKAKMWAQIVSGVIVMALQLGTGIAGGSALPAALSKLGLSIASTANFAYGMFLGGTLLSAGGIGIQGYNISAQYDSATTSAEVTDAKAWLQLIQQMLDETQEELEEIVSKMNNLLSHMFEVLKSELEEQKTIANQIGQMA